MFMRGRYALLKRLLLLVIGLVVGLSLAETGLRIAGLGSTSPYQPDLILGSKLRPNYAGWNTKEGTVNFQINRAGFRDREHPEVKPDDTLRIAVLGDSYCEALQVELAETFWATIERETNACKPLHGKRIEVLNFGVSGYGTTQELLMLRHQVWKYEPDIVLLAFLTGNDVRNNSREIENDELKPYFVLNNNVLVLDNSFTQQPFFTSTWIYTKDWLVRSSHLLTLLYQVRHRTGTLTGGADGIEAGLDDFVYAEPQTPTQQNAWILTERLIEQMKSEVDSHGATFVVVTLTNGVQVHPDPLVRASFAASVGVADLGYPDRRIASLADRLDCRSIVLVDHLAPYALDHKVFLHGFENTRLGTGHWNALGHRIAGETIATQLCSDTELWEN